MPGRPGSEIDGEGELPRTENDACNPGRVRATDSSASHGAPMARYALTATSPPTAHCALVQSGDGSCAELRRPQALDIFCGPG